MRTAVVVGAGVGGLATAGVLARSGWQVTLVERAARLRGSGSALVIWPSGAAALGALGVTLADIAIPMPTSGIRRPDGRWLLAPHGAGAGAGAGAGDGAADGGAGAGSVLADPVIVHSDDLHDALMAGLSDKVDIHTGTEITTVRAGTATRPSVATAKQRFEADLVVAADGCRSLVRTRLAPASVITAAGNTAWRAVIPWFRVPKLADSLPPAGQLLGIAHHFSYATLGERGSLGGPTRGGIYWTASVPGAPRPESTATQLSLLRRWFADWAAPVTELLGATEPDDLSQQAGEELRPLPARFHFPVGTGGIVLLGDAAHAAPPNLSQGACLAFEDAATLASLVRDSLPGQTLSLALAEYTQARRARAALVTRVSHRLGRIFQAQGGLSVRARDVLLGRLSPQFIDRAIASTQFWEPPR